MSNLYAKINELSPQKRELLLQKLKEKQVGVSANAIVPLARDSSSTFPLSFAQQRIWFLDQLFPGNAVYTMSYTFRLTGALDIQALTHSLNALIARHESLRTTFQNSEGQPRQSILPALRLDLPVIDLQEMPASEREALCREIATQDALRPFHLECVPLLRPLLLRMSAEEHLLLLSIHHIIFDGWSLEQFLQELAQDYQRYLMQAPPVASSLPIHYVDFACWQREHLQGAYLNKLLDYWSTHLQDAPLLLELPGDRPRAAVQSFRGDRVTFQLSTQLAHALRTLSRKEGVTLFMTLLASWQALLFRYSGLEDMLIGVPVADRRFETEKLIGCFVNLLVMRAQPSPHLSFREFLQQVRQTALDAYAHKELPFELLVEKLQPKRDLSYPPIVQVIFNLRHSPTRATSLAGVHIEVLEGSNRTTPFDLTLDLTEIDDGELRGFLEYNTNLFDKTTIQRLLSHWCTLLEAVVTTPQQRLASLPLLSQEVVQQQVIAWNQTETSFPALCLHQLFEQRATQTPDAIAVSYEGSLLTYGELNQRANKLAHYLGSFSEDQEPLIGIYVERSLEMLVGLFAVLKAGSAYVPLDPDYPQERLAFMIEDAQIGLVLTQARLSGMLQALNKPLCIVCVDVPEGWSAHPAYPLQRTLTPQRLAYVIYTSGSTGTPKGVQVPHQAVVNLLSAMQQYFPLEQRDVLLAVTTLSFDIAALELFLPLTTGATVAIVGREVVLDGRQLASVLSETGATIMQATPITWRILLEAGWSGNADLKMLCGGEALPYDLARQIRKQGASLWNLYGPTETTIWSLLSAVTNDCEQGTVPIGRPIANTQVYILDRYRQPVPIGVPGEVYLGGAGVACGYLHRPDLTAQRFVPDPFSQVPGKRIYRTGDLARYLADGSIAFLGRSDYQLKIRGFRIEPGEIEAVLSSHPAVQLCVVHAKEHGAGQRSLTAYVVLVPGMSLTVKEMHNYLRQSLPDYMVPPFLVVLDALPVTPNGKIARLRLPQPDWQRPEQEEAKVAPRDFVELYLIQIWEDILGISSIGINDNFFELGGTSLQAIQMVNQIQKIFVQSFPLTSLFQYGTIEHLASLLRSQVVAVNQSSLVDIQPKGSKRPCFAMHQYGGSVLCYLALSQCLGLDQPFYGLQPPSLNERNAVFTSIEDMASHYIQAMCAKQPEGPYILLGFSFGGFIAFEVAQQLQKQGDEVALLALLDTECNDQESKERLRQAGWWSWALGEYASAFSLHNIATHDLEDQLDYMMEQLCASDKVPLFYKLPDMRQALKLQYYTYHALLQYTPVAYPERITLFKAQELIEGASTDPYLGWKPLAAGGIEVYEVPGKHDTIIERPHVFTLAEKLQESLAKAQVGYFANR